MPTGYTNHRIENVTAPSHHPLEEVAWKSDHPPLSGNIRQRIKALRQDCVYTLEETQKEILRMPVEAELQILRDQRENLTRRIEKLDAIIAPWKDLPSEILAEILNLANEDSGTIVPPYCAWGIWLDELRQYNWPLPKEKDTHPEFVCSFWRKVARQTPSLWRTGALFYRGYETFSNSRNGHDLWRQRSDMLFDRAYECVDRGMTNLSLTLSDVQEDYHDVKSFLGSFYMCSKRLEVIAQFSFVRAVIRALFTGIIVAADLEVLSLEIRNPLKDPNPGYYNIKSVEFFGWPTTHLKRLVISGASFAPEAAFVIFSESPNLETCTLSIGLSMYSFPKPKCGVILLQVEELSLTFTQASSYSIKEFCDSLSLPSIRKVEFRMEDAVGKTDSEGYPSLIQRSSHGLESCKLMSPGMIDSANARRLLDVLPRLSKSFISPL